jgi:hypothetical protein
MHSSSLSPSLLLPGVYRGRELLPERVCPFLRREGTQAGTLWRTGTDDPLSHVRIVTPAGNAIRRLTLGGHGLGLLARPGGANEPGQELGGAGLESLEEIVFLHKEDLSFHIGATQHNMGMRMGGVIVISRDPVEGAVEITGDLRHEQFDIRGLPMGGIVRRHHNDPKLPRVVCRRLRSKCFGVWSARAIEWCRLTAWAFVLLEIPEMAPRGACLGDARLDKHRLAPRCRPRDETPDGAELAEVAGQGRLARLRLINVVTPEGNAKVSRVHISPISRGGGPVR